MKVTISIDAMGGDIGPDVVVPASLDALAQDSDLHLILVGDQALLEPQLAARTPVSRRITIQHASQQVEMSDLPSRALRTKKDSSMRVAINLVKEGRADACVSAGNTGALMATARFVLKMLPCIDRPAITTAIPSIHGHTHVLDLGANVDCRSKHLFQFAVMGAELVSAVYDKNRPKVGLLNIGQEEVKGNEQVKEAAILLASSDLNYIGFVEGNDIYTGQVDVVVADGFVGNVALKSSEGVAHMVEYHMKQEFNKNLFTRFAGLLARSALQSFRNRIDPRRYNGASLLGLRGIVIKSHGGADIFAFTNAIHIASLEVEKAIPQQILKHVERQLV